jgi:serine/threonine-protein kinase
VVHDRFAHSPGYIAMFLNEARLAARLSHSNIVQVFDVGVAGGQYYSVMEYVAGADLRKLLRISRHLARRFPVDVACTVAMEICEALTAAHTATDDAGHPSPIIHRDVSPDNILVSNEGAVKLTDFGVARLGKSETTDPGRRHGKMPYMPPEIFHDGSFRDARCDVYSLGVVLEEMLSGHDPGAAGVPPEPPPRPATLEKIVAGARSRSPGNRTASAAQLRDQLDAFLRTECNGPVSASAIGAFACELLSYIDLAPQVTPALDRTAPLGETSLEF